jgi:hypothetical protein
MRDERSLFNLNSLAVNAGLVLQRNLDLLAAPLRSHTCLTTSRSGIAIPNGRSTDFASFGGVDPTLHLGVVCASEPLDKTWANLTPPTSCIANVRAAVLADVNDTFFENSLSRYLVPELRIYEDLDIGQDTSLCLDDYMPEWA